VKKLFKAQALIAKVAALFRQQRPVTATVFLRASPYHKSFAHEETGEFSPYVVVSVAVKMNVILEIRR
jgi:hypothetical protein